MFGFIGTIIVGFIFRVIAKFIMLGKEHLGLILSAMLGSVDSVVATDAGRAPADRLEHRRLRDYMRILEIQRQRLA